MIVNLLAVFLKLVLFSGPTFYPVPPEPPISIQSISRTTPITTPGNIRSYDHVLGSLSAPDTLIVYEDFQCPACAIYGLNLRRALNEFKKTKVIVRHFPLISIHKNSLLAANAAEAAGVQDKFWEMHDKLFEKQSEWAEVGNPANLFIEYANVIGVTDLNRFTEDLDTMAYRERVNVDWQEAVNLNLYGVPAFYLNGKQLELSTDMEVEGRKLLQ